MSKDIRKISDEYRRMGINPLNFPDYKNAEAYAQQLMQKEQQLWIRHDSGSGSIIIKPEADA